MDSAVSNYGPFIGRKNHVLYQYENMPVIFTLKIFFGVAEYSLYLTLFLPNLNDGDCKLCKIIAGNPLRIRGLI